MAHRKGTKARGYVINQLVDNKCVPSRAALYGVINMREEGMMFVEDEWNTKGGGKRKHGKVNDCIDEDVREMFIGRFMIAVIPVSMKLPRSLGGNWLGGRYATLHVGSLEKYVPPKLVDICDYLGKSTRRRLHFSPRQFPTPFDLKEADSGPIFESLKAYIEHASAIGGTPVVCRSYKPGVKKFVCKHSKDCSYNFLLKWDDYGYYIHLHSDAKQQLIGSEIHTHSRVVACPYTKFGCMFCKEIFSRLSDAMEHTFKCTMYKHSKKRCKTCKNDDCEFALGYTAIVLHSKKGTL